MIIGSDEVGMMGSSQVGGAIVSVQHVWIGLGNGVTTNTATIDAVDTDYTVIVWGGYYTTDTATETPAYNSAEIYITNSTTITARRNVSDTTTTWVSASIVEFSPAVVESVEYGRIDCTTTDTTTDYTINSIDTTRSAILFCGIRTNYTGTNRAASNSGLYIADSTTVRSRRHTGISATVRTRFCVVQFKADALAQNVQEINTSSSQAITAVDIDNTWLCYGGQRGAYSSSMNGQYICYGALASSTSVTSTADLASANFYGTVIEFDPKYVAVATQRSLLSVLNDNTTRDLTITEVDVNKSFATYLGGTQGSGSGAQASRVNGAVKVQDSTTLRRWLGPDVGSLAFAISSEVISLT